MEGWHETELRVRYAETDKMGIVHHANYLVWFEAGRSEFCRAREFSYKEMEADGLLMLVAESYLRFKSPAFYDDILTIRTKVAEVRSRSIRFVYEVHRPEDDVLIAEGETMHLMTDADKKVRLIPELYRLKLAVDDPNLRAFPARYGPS